MRWTPVAARGRLPVHAERRGDNRHDVLLAAGGVVDPVVADVGRVARNHLIDAELAAAHRPELAAEPVHEAVRASPRLRRRLASAVSLAPVSWVERYSSGAAATSLPRSIRPPSWGAVRSTT